MDALMKADTTEDALRAFATGDLRGVLLGVATTARDRVEELGH